MHKFKEKITLNPVMTLIILIGAVILLSGILSLLGIGANYDKIDVKTGEVVATSENVTSMLSLSGLKYIFTSTVSNFTSFTPLSSLIIILIGIGIMEKSGFLRTVFTIMTKYFKKYTITFWLILVSIIFSIVGDIGYVVMIPIAGLLFYYGRRNPLIGIVAAYAGLTCGSGLSVFLTSLDSEMLKYSLVNAHLIDSNYTIGGLAFLFIMIVAIIAVSIVLTIITEKVSVLTVAKYEYKDEKKEMRLGRREYRGLIFAIAAGTIYLLAILYNIIPGLPFSGNLLDHTQHFYIDKLFSYESFFSDGFVFVVMIFFVTLGLFYGIGAKTIKDHNDFCEDLAHSLDGTGRTLILILLGSILINVFKKSNIGVVITVALSNILGNGSFSGIPLIIILFLISAVSTLFLTGPTSKWSIISTVAVPALMNNSLSPEFAQLIVRFGECMTAGITPLLAYFTIYIAYIEKYNQEEEPISLFRTIRYQFGYSMVTGLVLLLIIIGWFLLGLPIGIGGSITA